MKRKTSKKDATQIYTVLQEIRKIYNKKNIPINIYILEREIGIEWKRGESRFSISVDIPTNSGYIQEYTEEKQIFVEDYPALEKLIKRAKYLIRKRMI